MLREMWDLGWLERWGFELKGGGERGGWWGDRRSEL